MMPLAMAEIGEANTIRKISGRDEIRRHLAELGFVVGEEVYLVSRLGGNLILSVKDSRVALDESMALRMDGRSGGRVENLSCPGGEPGFRGRAGNGCRFFRQGGLVYCLRGRRVGSFGNAGAQCQTHGGKGVSYGQKDRRGNCFSRRNVAYMRRCA